MNFPRTITSAEFIFCSISKHDGNALFAAVSDERFAQQLPLAALKTQQSASDWCAARAAQWQTGECFVWTCKRRSDNTPLGQITLLPQNGRLALAYWVAPPFWHQGYATRMCRDLLAQLSSSGFHGKLWAGVHHWNHASQAVLKKIGFQPVTSSETVREYILHIMK